MAELIQLLIHFHPCALHRFLRAVDGIREQVATLADPLCVGPVLEFDAFELKEIAQGLEQFVFLYRFHGYNGAMRAGRIMQHILATANYNIRNDL